MANSTAISQIPYNQNLLQSMQWQFTIPDLPFANYFCQTITLPGVSTTPPQVATPFSPTFRHGDTLIFEPLTLTFLLDEDLRVFEETFIWLSTLTNPVKFKQFYPKFKNKYFDGILMINTNANTPNLRIRFKNVHPIALGTIQLASNDTPDNTLFADLTLQYDYYEFERINPSQ